jgi:hypothetical protein
VLRSVSMMPSAPTRNVIQVSNRWITARAVLTALVLCVFLSACLITRLYAFKQQFCEYQDNFSFSLQDDFRITLKQPVLLDKDVIWLAGAEPNSSQQNAAGKHMHWLVDKVLPPDIEADPAFDQLTLDLEFVAENDRHLLQQAVMDKRFSYMLSPDLMDRHAENVCHSTWLVLGRSGEIDLADADLSNQPDHQEVLEFMGQPTAIIDEGTGLLFEYRLRGSERQGRQYSFEFWHDPDSGELLRSSSTSIRFVTTTDFRQKKMWVKVK